MRALLAVFAALGLAACSATGPEPAELKSFKEEVKPKVAWKTSAGESGEFIFLPGIWEGDFFVAGSEGEVARLDGRNGKRKWRVELDLKLSGGVGAGDGAVVVGTSKGEVIALDATNGKQLWRAKLSSEVLSPPVIGEAMVFVRSGDGRVAGFDRTDGLRKWEYIPTAPPPLVLRGAFGLTLEEGSVYFGLPGGKLVAVNASNGALLWETAVAVPKGDTELERVSDIVSNPIVENGQVCAIAFQGRVACFDSVRGTLAWARNASSVAGLAAGTSAFFYVDDTATIHAVDRTSGGSLWKQAVLLNRGLGEPGVVGKYVVAGDFEGYLHLFDMEDGRLVGRLSTDGSPISGPPIQVGERNFVVQTREGTLYAVSLR
jgi:outer membrane protein assembly factor BamB